MPNRRIILIALAAVLAIANLAWFALSRPAGEKPIAAKEKAVAAVSDRPLRNPFPTAREVRLFVESGYGTDKPIYSKPKGRLLTPAQRSEFESLIKVHTIASDEAFAACFIPHHFFRYFDKSGKLVGELQVCFCCAGVKRSEDSPIRLAEGEMLSADFGRLNAFVASLGERTDVDCIYE